MAYQKPEVVAKSAAKESFVAGCPTHDLQCPDCTTSNQYCMCGPLE